MNRSRKIIFDWSFSYVTGRGSVEDGAFYQEEIVLVGVHKFNIPTKLNAVSA